MSVTQLARMPNHPIHADASKRVAALVARVIRTR